MKDWIAILKTGRTDSNGNEKRGRKGPQQYRKISPKERGAPVVMDIRKTMRLHGWLNR